ncbi:hypothetical protein CQ018_16025 [Arthrobacter sp. MYb227]|uniref:hypothetical protein n=1 Tax=Arthrobacter sp. MYb227 TaxID=1848601 RepID=UPI000D45ED63|nr:hypothetical protein [Arthrobacter sp. MYb227]PQZ89053.1 hypothetical protein CQ018_16025 [Arthrobacter sp. MYb227]
MSALTGMKSLARPGEQFPGYTRIGAHALSNAARGIAGNLFDVDPYLVRVFLRDDAGYLALSINLPLSLSRRTVSLLQDARTQRPILGQQFTALTGALVSKVDIRITGVVAAEGWT